jgi:hypothetical protein
MSYARKVELQREQNRVTEVRRKKAKEAARRAGIAGLGLSADRRHAVQPEGGAGWFKSILNAMDPRLWKSKKTLKKEAEIAEKKAAQEAADAKKIGEGK